MSICYDKSILTTLKSYMELGWEVIKNDFYESKIAKKHIMRKSIQNQYLLEAIGAIRKFHIESMFNCCNSNNSNYY